MEQREKSRASAEPGSLADQLRRARAEQAAVAKLLRIVSHTRDDPRAALDAIACCGRELFDGMTMSIRMVEGDNSLAVATTSPALDPHPVPLSDESLAANRAIGVRRMIHVPDAQLTEGGEATAERARRLGFRACLSVPMTTEDGVIGAVSLTRETPGVFPDHQIALLETFAAQAAIAIDKVRLFKELQARNDELNESLEQQTATSEILRIISRSPTDIQPVLDAVAQSAARLCNTEDVYIRRIDADTTRVVAHLGKTPMPAEAIVRPLQLRTIVGTLAREGRTIHIADVTERHIIEKFPDSLALAARSEVRTLLYVPLLREGVAIGVIAMRRPKVRPFTDKQIKLLETFADQAVIAIENVRLFEELQARNAELTETLDQQTATSEILHAISKSLTDAQPVFESIVRSGARLFPGHDVVLRLVKGDNSEIVATTEATHDGSPHPTPLNDVRRSSTRAIVRREVVEIIDAIEYAQVSEDTRARQAVRGTGAILYVPMLRENDAIGALGLARRTPGPFTPKQIEVIKSR